MNTIDLIYVKHHADDYPKKMPHYIIPYYDLTLLFRGSMTYEINGEQLVMNAGDVICLPPGTRRARDEGTERTDFISFNFTVKDAPTLPESAKKLIGGDIRLLVAALDEFSQRLYVDAKEKSTHVLACILLILEDKIKEKSYSTLTLKIIEYIHANISSKITLGDIGEAMFFSPVYCDSVFRNEVGKPIIDYLIDVRITEAKNLLVGGILSLTDVSESVGFSDYNYFSRVFKKRTGYTPSEYKRIAALGQ